MVTSILGYLDHDGCAVPIQPHAWGSLLVASQVPFASPPVTLVTIHCKVSFLFESYLIVCKGRIVSASFTLLSQLYIWLMDGAHEIFVEETDGWMDGWISKSVIVSFDARHSCLFPETYFIQE